MQNTTNSLFIFAIRRRRRGTCHDYQAISQTGLGQQHEEDPSCHAKNHRTNPYGQHASSQEDGVHAFARRNLSRTSTVMSSPGQKPLDGRLQPKNKFPLPLER